MTDEQMTISDRKLLARIEADEVRLAVRCQRCRRWLTDPSSTAIHYGPRCAKAVGNV